jgi:hypothetical protein
MQMYALIILNKNTERKKHLITKVLPVEKETQERVLESQECSVSWSGCCWSHYFKHLKTQHALHFVRVILQ